MDCESKYTVAVGNVIQCVQHLGPPDHPYHSARYMGIRVYWSDEEADR